MRKLIELVAKIELIISICFLAIFVIATCIQVISRYFHISVLWTEELSVNAFIWSMLLGAALMTGKKRHFSFTYLKNKLKNEKQQKFLTLGQNAIILCFSAVCLIYSIEIVTLFWHSKWITIPLFKQGYVWLILPLMFSSIILFILEDSFNEVNALLGKKQ